MPSAPNPNSPYLDSQLQSLFGAKETGMQTAGMPTPQVSPPTFPNPPAPSTNAPGRPASGNTGPQPVAFPPPPAAFPQSPPNGQVIDRDKAGAGQVIDRGPSRDGQVIDRGPDAAGQVIDRGPAGASAGPVVSSGLPNPRDLMMQPPGTQVQSPLGVTQLDASGEAKTALSPEGQMKYQQAIVAKRRAFGPLPRLMQTIPGLPPPPVEVGKSWYNPFLGRFGR